MNPTDLLKVDINPAQILLNFLLAFALAYVWATVYRKTHSGISYTRSFFVTLIMMSPAIAMIMTAIGSNIALSLGLVGSLSIIRFRTVIKDPKDLIFLLVAIGIGLTSAANAWMVGVIGTAVISVMIIVLSKAGHGTVDSGDYILMFRSGQKEPWEAHPQDAQKLIKWKQLRSVTDVDSGTEYEFTYSIKLASGASPEKIVASFNKETIRNISVIAPENHLEL